MFREIEGERRESGDDTGSPQTCNVITDLRAVVHETLKNNISRVIEELMHDYA